jgi:hypothetical protein
MKSPDDESALERVATTKYTSQLDAFASRTTPRCSTLDAREEVSERLLGTFRLCKAGQKFLLNLLFSLDSNAQEIYTLVSCIAASMMFIDWERRQTQPKAKQQTKATHSGDAKDSVPRGVFVLCSCGFRIL